MILLPSALRPRWTVKYVLVSVVALYSSYCLLAGMPFFSHPLPRYSGEYDVGTIDIEAPCQRRNLSDATFKETGRPAFELETVLFSLYYPTVKGSVSRLAHHPWVPKPIALHGEGYARFAKINNAVTNNVFTFALWILAGSTTIPANVDVPIHGSVKTYHDYIAEQPMDNYGLPQFPVIVFSHGMASGRTSYTHYCAELASRGYIVAAIEHRDGSGPGTIIMNEKEPPRPLFHVNADMPEPKPEIADFKVMQLAMRQAEVEETVRVLRDINNGNGRAVFQSNPRGEGQDLAEWTSRLNMDRVVIGGHSYGATLALQTLKGAPSESLPFVGAIILDPGKQSGPLNDDINVPTLIVHSQSWSARHSIFQGRPHFTVVKDLVRKIVDEKKKYAWFMTAKGTTHPSVTDAPLIEPFLLAWTTGSTIDAREGVMQYVKISQQFLHYLDNGHRQSILREDVTHQEYDDPNPRQGNAKVTKYWQIHMAPSTACPAPGYCGLDDE
ncbi:Platelet-activating factor acetylhydrolase 2, cytoplasmic [Pseudocercospora fuligena]|uniref:Putative phospholipase n=1 Tax=Pseudocercospora fuligena TaxID=685502 RepID=A0A8H6R4R3_9PEZI|nr:Platelet-activating factor acetylhydrolase 2, cytoplasmic [Pseudocercospora fuligena]